MWQWPGNPWDHIYHKACYHCHDGCGDTCAESVHVDIFSVCVFGYFSRVPLAFSLTLALARLQLKTQPILMCLAPRKSEDEEEEAHLASGDEGSTPCLSDSLTSESAGLWWIGKPRRGPLDGEEYSSPISPRKGYTGHRTLSLSRELSGRTGCSRPRHRPRGRGRPSSPSSSGWGSCTRSPVDDAGGVRMDLGRPSPHQHALELEADLPLPPVPPFGDEEHKHGSHPVVHHEYDGTHNMDGSPCYPNSATRMTPTPSSRVATGGTGVWSISTDHPSALARAAAASDEDVKVYDTDTDTLSGYDDLSGDSVSHGVSPKANPLSKHFHQESKLQLTPSRCACLQ